VDGSVAGPRTKEKKKGQEMKPATRKGKKGKGRGKPGGRFFLSAIIIEAEGGKSARGQKQRGEKRKKKKEKKHLPPAGKGFTWKKKGVSLSAYVRGGGCPAKRRKKEKKKIVWPFPSKKREAQTGERKKKEDLHCGVTPFTFIFKEGGGKEPFQIPVGGGGKKNRGGRRPTLTIDSLESALILFFHLTPKKRRGTWGMSWKEKGTAPFQLSQRKGRSPNP